jgi:type I restriction enzyme S subunit
MSSARGVEPLRQLIRSLAVKGRLTQRRQEPLSDLPPGWEWRRLTDLVVFSEAGWSPSCVEQPRREGRWGVLKVSAVSWDCFDAEANKELPAGLEPRPQYEVKHADFLLSRANTAELVAKSVVVKDPPPRLLLSDKIIRLRFREHANAEYVNLVNNSAAARDYYRENASGTSASMKNVSRAVVLNLPVPVPPPEEQARIVARVDELMRLCDALEEKGRLEAEQHARLLSTLLGTLTDSATPEELAANWQRVAEHFDLLLDRPEAVDALDSSVLTMAIQGRLTARHPSDEPAPALLERVIAEKRKLLVTSKQRLDKPSAPLSDVEQRFQLPQNWKWARLQELAIVIVDCPHSTPKFVQSGLLCLDTNSFKKGQLLEHKLRYVDEATYAERIERLEPRPGDLVFAREGSVGESLIIPPGIRACLGQRVMLFRFSRLISVEYVRLAISSPNFLDALLELHKGIGAKHVNVGDMREAVIPVPPVAEQLRIVERVADLTRLCATLRERLQAQQATQSRLAEALVEQATA